MNQIRTFLVLAWLMVAVLLWMEWGKEKTAAAQPQQSGAVQPGASVTVPGAAAGSAAVPSAPTDLAPIAPTPGVAAAAGTAAAGAQRVVVQTDVLRVVLEGGNVVQADLLEYPQTRDEAASPVRMLDTDPSHYYAAQAGWVSSTNAAPSHEGQFVPENAAASATLAEGEQSVIVPFLWTGADGVTIRRSFVLTRGNYAIEVRDEIVNGGSAVWQGFPYRQLIRTAPVVTRGMTNPESYSLVGATWFGSNIGYGRRQLGDFEDDGPLNARDSQVWIAMVQHHFFSAWIPAPDDDGTISMQVDRSTGAPRYLIREIGAPLAVAAGQQASTTARLWVGPKQVGLIQAQGVRGLDRVVDYSRFSIFAMLGEGLFWILAKLHGLIGNWGWSIIGLVLLVKLALYPLSVAQYKSMAKMRKFQPRIAQLKERYGDDKQKFQMAMMELYKKEKINPIGGCLPVLLQMPVFFALYWVLLESVELRHAPWMLWIHDLTARDPYFILPVLNIAIMWATQKLTPMVGMDPMQQKIMQFMPLVFGAIMIFFPSGLVLYWVTNGGLGLLQQWWMIRRYSEAPAKA
ncbi:MULTISPECIES: membrane protein insertase YidC [Luteimonas]|uniref:Membrane protein insertase YidC n=1 Tax=Luteimonas chenhongjianii TaxID=2006110 RepID=A0A290XBC1_9GAMM|nr:MULTISPECIES: membrane protein insertase YidC [Luteimonas]ATD66464.1 membrane protein insertase YidC [Luteimonas chenhongjianii]RPD85299.1 membrane protein insertase YidC [Luteimonas sp. 100069]